MAFSLRQARSIIRKSVRRVPEGEEINYLNITPMLDIMTILLVFLIKASSQEVSTLNMRDVALPMSSTEMKPMEMAVAVTIAPSAILVEGNPIVAVKEGDVDPSEKSKGAYGMEISKLTEELKKHHTRIKMIQASKDEQSGRELTIIADKATPFRLLSAVMYSAGQAEFQHYRMIVLRREGD